MVSAHFERIQHVLSRKHAIICAQIRPSLMRCFAHYLQIQSPLLSVVVVVFVVVFVILVAAGVFIVVYRPISSLNNVKRE